MSDRDEFGAFLIGFVVGGITGAVAALLLTPQSGEQTRTLIRDKSVELYDKAGKSIDEAYTQAEHVAIEARGRFEDLARTTKERSGELQHRGQVLLEEQKAKVAEIVSSKKKASDAPKDDAPASA